MTAPLLPLALLLAVAGSARAPQEDGELAVVRVEADDARIDRSCRVEIGPAPIADVAGDGVLHVTADGVTVDLAGAELRGAAPDADPDTYAGIGIVVRASGVTLRGARVAGYRCAILAIGADGLVLEDCDVSDNFRQRLGSTPEAEDAADWLRPHANDAQQWRREYGAGICIERAREVVVRRCRARDVQNGLILDRVEAARVYDNDFSFLSGWGLALWRSSRNAITRNAFDFCIRGYSHGVYNRGQDSAGILMFEQCSGNVFAENSATHGGDGFFAFSGNEALGEAPPPARDFDHARRGNANNVLAGNDFSYAAAHGIEVTFGFGNQLYQNRLVGNAICGVWGGYSQDTLIARNEIAGNGDAGYGLERGGVNVEHGARNEIRANRFERNACGVHLWWDEDPALARLPWAEANGTACAGNRIVDNEFVGDALAIQIRGCDATVVDGNRMEGVGVEIEADPPPRARTGLAGNTPPDAPRYPLFGETRPVGARSELRGRERIVMTEWGPYDWQGPYLVRGRDAESGAETWTLLGDEPLAEFGLEGDVEGERDGRTIRVRAARAGTVRPYRLWVAAGGERLTRAGVASDLVWDVRAFAWERDPRADAAAWRTAAAGGVAFRVRSLDLCFGAGGPGELAGAGEVLRAAGLPAERFGTLAETRVDLSPGRWRIRTLSDDGIRVWVDGELRIDDWTWHPPTRRDAVIELAEGRALSLRVEHFELDGHAVLAVTLEPE